MGKIINSIFHKKKKPPDPCWKWALVPAGFDLIIAPFRMFMHLLEVDDQLAALRNIRKHLVEQGTFIFDVFVPDLDLIKEGLTDILDFEGQYEPGKALRRYVTSQPDLIRQLLHVTFKLEWEENDELQHLVERAGFSKHTIYGDFSPSPLQKDSKEFVVVCRK